MRFFLLFLAALTIYYTFASLAVAPLIEPLPDAIVLNDLKVQMEALRRVRQLDASPPAVWSPIAAIAVVTYAQAIPYSILRVLAPLIVVVPVSLVAWALYRMIPLWDRRRSVPVDADHPLQAEVERLARSVSCPVPALRCDARQRQSPNMRVIGSSAHASLVLDVSYWERVSLATNDPLAQRFRAFVLHELGHVKHRDVEWGYAAFAVWAVLVVPLLAVSAALLVLTFSTPLQQGAAVALADATLVARYGVFVQVASLILVVMALFAAVIRTRELHADWFANVAGHGSGLLRALSPTSEVPGTRMRRLLWQLSAFHPTASRRRWYISRPNALFALDDEPPWQSVAFHVGLLIGLMLSSAAVLAASVVIVWDYVLSWGFWRSFAIWTPLFPTAASVDGALSMTPFLGRAPLAVLPGIVLFAALGVQTQRGTFLGLAAPASGSTRNLWQTAVVAATGVLIGFQVTPALGFPLMRASVLPAIGWMVLVALSMRALLSIWRDSTYLLVSEERAVPPRAWRRVLVWAIGCGVATLALWPIISARFAIFEYHGLLMQEVLARMQFIPEGAGPTAARLLRELWYFGLSCVIALPLLAATVLAMRRYAARISARIATCRSCGHDLGGLSCGTCARCDERQAPWLYAAAA